jgi:hypothetical protein
MREAGSDMHRVDSELLREWRDPALMRIREADGNQQFTAEEFLCGSVRVLLGGIGEHQLMKENGQCRTLFMMSIWPFHRQLLYVSG